MSEINLNQPFRLVPTIQNYLWGRVGRDSIIYSLIAPEYRETMGDNKRFAELWYGAYPAFSSMASQGGAEYNLHELIAKYPDEMLGATVAKRFGGQLPFLFKVLSIDKPLSIQSHPDKRTASRLHVQSPQHYRDSNHKPEMIVALTPTEVLYGFRRLEDIRRNINNVPELRNILTSSQVFSMQKMMSFSDAEEVSAIEYIYRGLYSARSRAVERYCRDLFLRVEDMGLEELTPEYNWILKLRPVFPDGDVGVFAFFIHNLISLNVGEVLYVEPNTVHSYLGGEVLEFSASSDNTIRGGLTGKFLDKESLLNSINYNSFFDKGMTSARYDAGEGGVKSFVTPSQEFKVRCVEVAGAGAGSNNRSAEVGLIIEKDLRRGTPVLMFCLKGCSTFCVGNRGYSLAKGEACFLPAGMERFEPGGEANVTYYVSVPM